MTTKLTITATSILETKPITFDFLIYPVHYNQLPQYDELQKNYFCCIRRPTYFTIVTWLWTSILKASNFNTIPFLTNLTKQLHDDFKVEYREEGAPLRPDDTLI
jgi:hypothetical protein